MTVVVVVPSPYGPLAFTDDQLREAAQRAQELDPRCASANESDTERQAPPQPLLDATEAAGVLGVKASWLLQQAREGRISSVKLGKYIRFDVAKLVRELERRAW
jgi:hypothetical protein